VIKDSSSKDTRKNADWFLFKKKTHCPGKKFSIIEIYLLSHTIAPGPTGTPRP